jgi:DNA-binding MarR family transcriptional regulator
VASDALSEKQAQVLDYLEGFQERNCYPPSQRTIAQAFRVTIWTVQRWQKILHLKGYLRRSGRHYVPTSKPRKWRAAVS